MSHRKTCCDNYFPFRSGHRMVVWRNYLILFGGFYEAMREVRWYNDIFFYSFQERKWSSVMYKPHASVSVVDLRRFRGFIAVFV